MSELWKTLLNDMEAAKTEPVQQPQQTPFGIPQQPVSTGIPNLNTLSNLETPKPIEPEIVEDDSDDDAEDELDNEIDDLINPDEDGIDPDIPNANSFDLTLPTIPKAAPSVLDLTPRKPGRPTQINNASAVLEDITNAVNEKELDKSNSNIKQKVSQTTQIGKEITITIPKKLFRDFGESLQRIATTIIESSKD